MTDDELGNLTILGNLTPDGLDALMTINAYMLLNKRILEGFLKSFDGDHQAAYEFLTEQVTQHDKPILMEVDEEEEDERVLLLLKPDTWTLERAKGWIGTIGEPIAMRLGGKVRFGISTKPDEAG